MAREIYGEKTLGRFENGPGRTGLDDGIEGVFHGTRTKPNKAWGSSLISIKTVASVAQGD